MKDSKAYKTLTGAVKRQQAVIQDFRKHVTYWQSQDQYTLAVKQEKIAEARAKAVELLDGITKETDEAAQEIERDLAATVDLPKDPTEGLLFRQEASSAWNIIQAYFDARLGKDMPNQIVNLMAQRTGKPGIYAMQQYLETYLETKNLTQPEVDLAKASLEKASGDAATNGLRREFTKGRATVQMSSKLIREALDEDNVTVADYDGSTFKVGQPEPKPRLISGNDGPTMPKPAFAASY